MKLDGLPFLIFGDVDFRGKCDLEAVEQVSFFNRLRKRHPETWGRLGLHPRNEQQLRGGQYKGIIKQKAEGMTKGASDVIIPGAPAFVCEIKRCDRTKSRWEDGQIEYLTAAHEAGCFACVALGAHAAWQAFEAWRAL